MPARTRSNLGIVRGNRCWFMSFPGFQTKRLIAACAAAFALGLSIPAQADDLRCGNKLIMEGDTRAEVRALCGAPADIEKSSILQWPSYQYFGRRVYYGTAMIEVPVESWLYNFGPNLFMRRIRFVDGLVDEIEVLGYGYYEDRG